MDPKDFRSPIAGRPVLTPAGYWAFVPNPLPPPIEWKSQLVSAVADAEQELGRLAVLIQTFPFSRRLIQPFIRREAVISPRQKYQNIVEKEPDLQRMGEVIDFLFSRPVFTVQQLADELGLTHKTAQEYIVTTQWAGIIKGTAEYSEIRIYQADEVLRELIV